MAESPASLFAQAKAWSAVKAEVAEEPRFLLARHPGNLPTQEQLSTRFNVEESAVKPTNARVHKSANDRVEG